LTAPGLPARKRLFAAPLRDFTNVRDELARDLRGSGQADEAKALAKIKKPSVALWIANQLGRLSPAEVKALIEATARLRHGQSAAAHGTSADELREAMRAQREALARLIDAAGRAALEAGTKLSQELQRRVQNTVQAAAASDPEALSEGTLETELQPSGFEGLLGAGPTPLPTAPHKDDAAAVPERKKQEAEAARALRKAEHEAQQLDARAKELAGAATESEREATRARERADEARRRAEEARQKADAAAARALELRGAALPDA
jgi:hypothetical protein